MTNPESQLLIRQGRLSLPRQFPFSDHRAVSRLTSNRFFHPTRSVTRLKSRKPRYPRSLPLPQALHCSTIFHVTTIASRYREEVFSVFARDRLFVGAIRSATGGEALARDTSLGRLQRCRQAPVPYADKVEVLLGSAHSGLRSPSLSSSSFPRSSSFLSRFPKRILLRRTPSFLRHLCGEITQVVHGEGLRRCLTLPLARLPRYRGP